MSKKIEEIHVVSKKIEGIPSIFLEILLDPRGGMDETPPLPDHFSKRLIQVCVLAKIRAFHGAEGAVLAKRNEYSTAPKAPF